MANTVRKWNPAWGPEPERRPMAKKPSHRRWMVSCAPCDGEEYLVTGPDVDYPCARCGEPMRKRRLRPSEPKPPLVPKVAPGDRFGRLEVVEVGQPGPQGRRALCRCVCGQTKEVWVKHLLGGSTKSCGCLQREGPQIPWRRRSYK